ncbi:MAG: uracil-DNA glycosylase [Actinobacteria bacterium]|nr:uracil-DNA glycosylase [Actinomycetota bacterium]NBY15139.1 uracil-DNA glycosylase [Actinomycetota bacterium]
MELWSLLPKGWQDQMIAIRPQLKTLNRLLMTQIESGVDVVPAFAQVFAALPESPNSVSVLIFGQDPYSNPEFATGLAFSVPTGSASLPPTLRNILREVESDIGQTQVRDGNLEPWKEQGVLLLNSILTTESGLSLAHKTFGWQQITLELVRAVSRVNPEVIAVLWGQQARTLRAEFKPGLVIESVHPSPLSAYRGFFGSRPFSQVNRLLLSQGRTPINW